MTSDDDNSDHVAPDSAVPIKLAPNEFADTIQSLIDKGAIKREGDRWVVTDQAQAELVK